MHRLEDVIKMALKKIGCDGVDWIQPPQDRDQWQVFVKTVMNVRVS